MYFPYFIAYMAAGMIIGLVVFFWALKTGQFKDQQRARFLPLEEGSDPAVSVSRFNRIEGYALVVLVLIGLSATAAVLIVSLMLASAPS
jgi:cbb3-type cytochrome oxidase maturation protein